MSNTGSSGDMIQSPISLPVPVVRESTTKPNKSQEQGSGFSSETESVESVRRNMEMSVSPPIVQERVCKVELVRSPERRKVLHFGKRIGSPLSGSTPVQRKKAKKGEKKSASSKKTDKMSDEPATPGTPAQESGVILSDLNSRFANIVTRNASIVDENQRLQEELAQQGNNHKEELGRIKTFYEAEVKESHKLLNDAANEAFKMRQELESTVEKKNEAERKYEEKNLSERTARQLAEELQKEVDDMKAEQTQLRRKHQDLDAQKMSLNAQLVEAKSDADKFRNQLADEKAKLNQKNNELQSLQEKFETELRVRDVEIDEARKNQSSMLQQSLNMKSTHEESMSIAIDNIRDEHERDVKRLQKKFKEENARALEKLEQKLKSTQELLLAKRDEASKNRALMEQAIASKAKMEQELKRAKDLNLSLEADLASKNSLAKEEIADLKAKLADETEKVAKLEDTFRQKKEQYLAMEKECLTYRQLLEVEEARLNITPSPIRRKRGRAETRLSDCQTPAQKKSKSADNTLQEVDVSEIGATDNTRPDASCYIM